ncbi:hypothetical protein AAT19DRAFT_8503 [Rhodotorula toruloides]|uniref:Protein kinase domain-containing protein n=1 Tax=Rhodotorula toruloides TaxID=5286 RepID=A0A2T0AHG9_RHOTO|nr:hypothetical protein AAT19DRAFT_8503 [Rhodotorula toruloides]
MMLCARVRLRNAPLVSLACFSNSLRRPLVSPLSSLVLPPDPSTPTVQQHVDSFEKALNTRIPPRRFVDYPAASDQLDGRSTSPSTECSIRSAQVDGCEGAIPLTFETIDESTTSYVDAVSRQVDEYFRAKREQPADVLRLPAELYNAEEPPPELHTFATEEDLVCELFADLRPVARVLGFVDDPMWVAATDSMADDATLAPVTPGNLVIYRREGGEWEGAVLLVQAWTLEYLRQVHASLQTKETLPYMVMLKDTNGSSSVYSRDEASGMLQPADATTRFAVQLNAMVTSRIRRSRRAGLNDPYVPLIVTNGSHFFVALGKIDTIGAKEYGRIGLTRIEYLADYPLRKLVFAHALMHRLVPLLPPPPGFSLDEALEASTHPSALLKSQADARRVLLAVKTAEDPDKSGGKGEKSAHKERELGGGRKGGEEGAQAGSLVQVQKESPLPARFDFVANWWGGGQSRPTTYELVAPGPRFAFRTPGSPAASEPSPTILQDRLFVQRDSLFVSQSSELNLIFKKIEIDDAHVDEFLNERACLEELYQYDDAGDFLVGYVGFFESISKSQYCLVTEAGDALEDWTEETCVPVVLPMPDQRNSADASTCLSDAVIKLVEQLHRHGYVHGDLAERNIVRTPAGLRLIDLGRARKAEGDECVREMEELKKVMAGEAEWMDYSFLGYYFW